MALVQITHRRHQADVLARAPPFFGQPLHRRDGRNRLHDGKIKARTIYFSWVSGNGTSAVKARPGSQRCCNVSHNVRRLGCNFSTAVLPFTSNVTGLLKSTNRLSRKTVPDVTLVVVTVTWLSRQTASISSCLPGAS